MKIHKSVTGISSLLRGLLGASIFLYCAPVIAQDSCDWGSFDASRINYSGGALTQWDHNTMRGIIESNGGVIAAPTSTLTAAYLGGVDVFYTSMLHTRTGTLSAAEQAALQGWISTGGTLIVTADIFPFPAYESFTSFYGVTGYTTSFECVDTTGFPVDVHPITDGVTSYKYCTGGTFTSGIDALVLGDNGFGSDFIAVLEPATGFVAGGRILVIGDHNMFTENDINRQDNIPLANNISAWACEPPISDTDAILDTDGDDVDDPDDICPDTTIPEDVPTVNLNPNHWALIDDNFDFDTVTKGKGKGPGLGYTTTDTAGCSCEQIIATLELGEGHTKHGCSISAMDDWFELVNP